MALEESPCPQGDGPTSIDSNPPKLLHRVTIRAIEPKHPKGHEVLVKNVDSPIWLRGVYGLIIDELVRKGGGISLFWDPLEWF